MSVTATANRHRISTIYASSHMSAANKECFFAHMGHSEDTSKANYQCPAAVQEIRIMGEMLAHMDGINHAIQL